MKKTNRILSVILCAVMVLTLIPAIGFIGADAAKTVSVSTADEFKVALADSTVTQINVAKSFSATAEVADNGVWAKVNGSKVLNLNGYEVKVTVNKTVNAEMIEIPAGAALSVTDTSSKKNGTLLFDSDLDSGNHYRYRCVLLNRGTLTVYGGHFTPGHYSSYYSAKYAKTVYKMTTGNAISNYGTCTIYGGTFTGRNYYGNCIENGSNGKITIYDAYLYAKGGADGLKNWGDSNADIYAIEISLNKETAVENDKRVTKGYPYGDFGVSYSMLCGSAEETSKTTSELKIQPKPTAAPKFEDGTTSVTFPVLAGSSCDENLAIIPFTANSTELNNVDGTKLSSVKWHYIIQSKPHSAYTYTTTETQGDKYISGWTITPSMFRRNYSENTDYKLILSPSYCYDGWSHSYTPASTGSVVVTLEATNSYVTFDVNGSGATVNPTKKAFNDKLPYGTLPVPTWKDHEFLGWFTSKTGGTQKTETDKPYASYNHTLYAHWNDVSKPKFTKNLDAYYYLFNDGTTALNLTVAADGGNVKYTWEHASSSFGPWTKLTNAEMPLVYSNGTERTFTYKGSMYHNLTLRCTASNEYGTAYSNTPVITGATPSKSAETDREGQFLLYVSDVVHVTSRGWVANGRVDYGSLKPGDKVTIYKGGTATDATVEAIEMFRKIIDSCEKGDNVGLLLKETDPSKPVNSSSLERGCAIVNKGSTLKANSTVYGTFKMYTKEEGGHSKPVVNGDKAQAYIGYESDVTATFSEISGSCIMPGDTQTGIKLTLYSPCVMYYGQSFAIREGGRVLGAFTVDRVSNGDTGFVRVDFNYNGGGENPYTQTSSTGGAKQKFNRENKYPAYKYIKKNAVYGELPSPVKESSIFTGWTKDKAGKNSVSSTDKVTSAITLYAQYKSTPVIVVSLDYNGADKKGAEQLSMKVNSPYSDLPVPEKTGYSFLGWRDPLGKLVSDGSKMAYNYNHTLTAQWGEDLEIYPEFTKDLPEICNLYGKISEDNVITGQSFTVAANDAKEYSWGVMIKGDTGWRILGSGKTFDLSKITPTIVMSIAKDGGQLTVFAIGEGGRKTQSKVCKLVNSSEPVPVPDPELVPDEDGVIKGDVDDNKVIDVKDARFALRAAINLADEGLDFSKPANREFKAADVDGNGTIDVKDARSILRVAIKLDKSF